MATRSKRMKHTYSEEADRFRRAMLQPVYSWKKAWAAPAKEVDSENSVMSPYRIYKWVKSGEVVEFVDSDDEEEEEEEAEEAEAVDGTNAAAVNESGLKADVDESGSGKQAATEDKVQDGEDNNNSNNNSNNSNNDNEEPQKEQQPQKKADSCGAESAQVTVQEHADDTRTASIEESKEAEPHSAETETETEMSAQPEPSENEKALDTNESHSTESPPLQTAPPHPPPALKADVVDVPAQEEKPGAGTADGPIAEESSR